MLNIPHATTTGKPATNKSADTLQSRLPDAHVSRPEVLMTPEKLYRIGEVIRYSGISRQTVHNYTLLGLITEAERTSGGHRLYPEEVFDRLTRIQELKKSKTLKEIRLFLDKENRS